MSKFRFHGDIHGKLNQFLENCDKNDISSYPNNVQNIQVGDFGFGFVPVPKLPSNVFFIRGNHDDPQIAAINDSYLKDGFTDKTDKGVKLMFIGGAESIDKHLRVEGVSWWRDEELTIQQYGELINEYEAFRPDVMVTHDIPQSIVKALFYGQGYWKNPSRTQQALDEMWQIHSPKHWIFGHYHVSKTEMIDECQFRCLAELEYFDIEL